MPAPLSPSSTSSAHPPSPSQHDTASTADTCSSDCPSISFDDPLSLPINFIEQRSPSPTPSHSTFNTFPTPEDQPPQTTTCIVCMDNNNDIALAPCNHSHCCLVCFQKSRIHVCPICRSPVTSVLILSTSVRLPVSLAAPIPTHRPPSHHSTLALPDAPRHLPSRRSMPSLHPPAQDDLLPATSRANSLSSSVRVASQAQSSVRSLSPLHNVALRQLRQTGSVASDIHPPSLPHLSSHIPTPASSIDSPLSVALDQSISDLAMANIVLVGHSKKMMVSLAQRLEATFPPKLDDHKAPRTKSTLYIDDKAVRLVLIESPLFSMEPQLVSRIQRHSPKLVLLCADFFNVSSFESIIRLDMEMLDYLNIPTAWVLVKSAVPPPKKSNFVEEADVRAAKHYLSKPRRSFVAQVDASLHAIAMRQLALHVYISISGRDDFSLVFSNIDRKQSRIPPRAHSLFCIRSGRHRKKQERHGNRLIPNLTRWLC